MKLSCFESLGERDVVGYDPAPRGIQYLPNSAVSILSIAPNASAVAASGLVAAALAGSAQAASLGVSSGALGGGGESGGTAGGGGRITQKQ